MSYFVFVRMMEECRVVSFDAEGGEEVEMFRTQAVNSSTSENVVIDVDGEDDGDGTSAKRTKFVCPHCESTFTRKHDLRVHLENPTKSCSIEFRAQKQSGGPTHTLSNNSAHQPAERPEPSTHGLCPYCGKTKKNLLIHLRRNRSCKNASLVAGDFVKLDELQGCLYTRLHSFCPVVVNDVSASFVMKLFHFGFLWTPLFFVNVIVYIEIQFDADDESHTIMICPFKCLAKFNSAITFKRHLMAKHKSHDFISKTAVKLACWSCCLRLFAYFI